jgi:hypothetical protein
MICSFIGRGILAWLACCCASGLVGPFAHATEKLEIQSSNIGFDGVYKAGNWTQILLEVKAGDGGAEGRLDLLTEDGDGVPVIFPGDADAEIKLAAGQRATVRLYAKAGPQRSSWHLQLRRRDVSEEAADPDEILWSQRLDFRPPQRATRELVVSVGPDAGVAVGAGLTKRPDEVSFLTATVKQAAELPDRVWGYEGVERIVLVASRRGLVDELTPQQYEALDRWVQLGGKLILSVGSRGPEVLAEEHPLRKFAPGKFVSLDPLRELASLSHFAGMELPRASITDANRPQVVRLAERTGRVELEQGGQPGNPPLVIRQPYGLGQVIFVAVELDHPALVSWKGHGRLMARLLPLGGPAADNMAAEKGRSLTHLGYDDLAGQLRAVLDQFPGVTVVSFTAAALFAVVLLLLIGPADYFLIGYLRLPRWLTWFTFTGVCLAFAAGTWYLGQLAHGTTTRVNQVELVDLDVSRGLVRGTVWTHVYSPTGRQQDVSLQIDGRGQDWTEVQGLLDWQGLPGNGLGGLASPQVSMDASPAYFIAPPGRVVALSGLPLRTASSKALSARWWGQTRLLTEVTPLRTNSYGHLEGELINPLPVKLTECLLASGEWLYRLEPLQPGQKVELSTIPALNLEARLTRRTVIDTKDLSTPWEPKDTDLPRIMQMLMLHDAVKGPTYTGMSHRGQPQIDLSEHIHLGRAVLMGRAETPAARLDLAEVAADDIQMQSSTWYRLVIPVQAREAITTAER